MEQGFDWGFWIGWFWTLLPFIWAFLGFMALCLVIGGSMLEAERLKKEAEGERLLKNGK